MNLIKKYHLEFAPIDMGFINSTGVKIFTLLSIFKIELFYHRNILEVLRILFNILIFSFIITSYNEFTDILILQTLSVLIVLNFDILQVLLNPNTPIIEPDKKGLYVDAELNKEENQLIIKGMHKNKIIFFIKNSTMDPKLLVPLMNEYLEAMMINEYSDLEEREDFPEYKRKFIQNNIQIEFVN